MCHHVFLLKQTKNDNVSCLAEAVHLFGACTPKQKKCTKVHFNEFYPVIKVELNINQNGVLSKTKHMFHNMARGIKIELKMHYQADLAELLGW